MASWDDFTKQNMKLQKDAKDEKKRRKRDPPFDWSTVAPIKVYFDATENHGKHHLHKNGLDRRSGLNSSGLQTRDLLMDLGCKYTIVLHHCAAMSEADSILPRYWITYSHDGDLLASCGHDKKVSIPHVSLDSDIDVVAADYAKGCQPWDPCSNIHGASRMGPAGQTQTSSVSAVIAL